MTETKSVKNVELRLANPIYEGGKYKIEFQGKTSTPFKLFGLNFRMFYDTRIFKPGKSGGLRIVLPEGYRQYNFAYGDSPTGWVQFGEPSGPITYVNGAIDLVSHTDAITIGSSWTKIALLEFTPISPLSGEICPSFILDLEVDHSRGGFLNNAGIVVKSLEGMQGTEFLTGSTIPSVTHYNWIQSPGTIKAPWGKVIKQECINI